MYGKKAACSVDQKDSICLHFYPIEPITDNLVRWKV